MSILIPIAFKGTPTTDEFNPPESPQEDSYGHQLFMLICAICISTKLAIDQSPLAPQIPKAKFFKILLHTDNELLGN